MKYNELTMVFESLYSELSSAGITEKRINDSYRATYNRFLSFMRESEFEAFLLHNAFDLFLVWIKPKVKLSRFKQHQHNIWFLEQFEETSKLPFHKHSSYSKVNHSRLTSTEYQAVLGMYKTISATEDICETTKSCRYSSALKFFEWQMGIGNFCCEDIIPEQINAYYLRREKEFSSSYVKHFHSFLASFKGSCYQASCDRIARFLPKVRMGRTNIDVLTLEEFEKVRMALSDKSSTLSLRDRAIGLLTLNTGLRSSDIVSLTLENINWDCSCISLFQQKTKRHISIPFSKVTGNALVEYILEERPDLKVPNVFLRNREPYGHPITRFICYHTSVRIMTVAEIRTNSNIRKGLHLFRHSLASRLLAQGTALPTISKILGHSEITATETYLSVDFTQLKKCALSVAKYPIKRGALI
ncbi:MAG: tyrosine-type recombinase/integrase [Sphaerochaeta sp.]